MEGVPAPRRGEDGCNKAFVVEDSGWERAGQAIRLRGIGRSLTFERLEEGGGDLLSCGVSSALRGSGPWRTFFPAWAEQQSSTFWRKGERMLLLLLLLLSPLLCHPLPRLARPS